jgi:iron complex outermembrane receptor protein
VGARTTAEKYVIHWGVPVPRLPQAVRAGRRAVLNLLSLALPALAALATLAALAPASAWATDTQLASLADLTLEQLSQVQVTSVSRRSERLADAPAAIFVITADDIRRSGASTLPEALRLAPNLEVMRADANQYAITARGFASVLANKLLVMIDGRTVYSPLFSGVFWEAQDVVIQDIERIEVVSGPGGTLWGTNAVNGVINIVTRSASETQGLAVTGRWGSELTRGAARYGGAALDGVRYRVYGAYRNFRSTERPSGQEIGDASERFQGGFRADWGGGPHQFMVQGDGYRSDIDQGPTTRRVDGLDLLARWVRQSGNGPALQVQAYYDRTTRDQPGAVKDELNTFDLELQHGVRPFPRHDVVWGAGYRLQPDRVVNLGPLLAFDPPNRTLAIASVFAEDDIELLERLALTAGVRLEHNQYTHLEVLPNARLAWKPSPERLFWGAVSRAVRAPSRIDREFYSPAAPPHVAVNGGQGFRSETSQVAELGYRSQPSPSASYSISLFYDDWDRLRSLEPAPEGPEFRNGIAGFTKGVEVWGSYRVVRWWRLSAGWTTQSIHLHVEPGVTVAGGNAAAIAALGNDPSHWWSVRSALDLGRSAELDVSVRHVGSLPRPPVPSYVALDARLGWAPLRRLEIAVIGRNLLDDRHPEWGAPTARPEFEREGFVQATIRL